MRKKKKLKLKMIREYIDNNNEIIEITIDLRIDFKSIYNNGLAPDDVFTEIIKEADITAKEVYNATPLIDEKEGQL